jgi:hypothetical protein
MVADRLLVGHTFPFYTSPNAAFAFRQFYVRPFCGGCLHREHDRLGQHHSSHSGGAADTQRGQERSEELLPVQGEEGPGSSQGSSESDGDSSDDSSCSTCAARSDAHYGEREPATFPHP